MTRGPKLKLTPDVQEKIVSLLRAGNYVETAAACAGIHKDTFYEWMKRAAKGEEPFAELAAAVHKALADGEARDVAVIFQASKEQWQAAAWRLERRFPDKWSRNDRVKVDGNLEVSDERLVGKLARLLSGKEEAEDPAKPEPQGT